ncbi:MAG TPA: ChbG/HpnK family deacetylase [Syntrophobacteraceae bacterium]|nr:ChbG/HpnK family deacetylase [Syntrophobacteraceae bacterium]
MVEVGRRVLIINADDLGYTRGVNEAIRQCFVAGCLRSATLMANGYAFDHAVGMLRDNEGLDVGVHLVLTELPPVLSSSKIRGLVHENGCLPATPGELAASLLCGAISKDAVRLELTAQITKVLDHGLKPTHLDSHKHVHVLPQVLETVVELARKYSIRWVRSPFDRTSVLCVGRLIERERIPSFCMQHLKAKLLHACRRGFTGEMRGSNLRNPDHFFGISLTGAWNEAVMVRLVKEVRPGVTEWMVHPGDCDGDLIRLKTRLLKQRETERDLLMSSELKDHIARLGITLSSFRTEDK